MNWRLAIRRLEAIPARFLFPSYGCCGQCARPWRIVDKHLTYDSDLSGIFALCEGCWKELTPETRLPHYRKLVESWIQWEEKGEDVMRDRWPSIEAAVKNES